jgi:hypothetical protein
MPYMPYTSYQRYRRTRHACRRRQLPSALLFLKNIRSVTAYYRSAPTAQTGAEGGAVPVPAPAPGGAVGEGEGGLRLLFRATRDLASSSGLPEGGATDGGLQVAVAGGPEGQQRGLLQSAITRCVWSDGGRLGGAVGGASWGPPSPADAR